MQGQLTDISAPHRWNITSMAYELTSNFAMATGATLTLDAGVVVKMRRQTTFQASGALISGGTATQPVVITSVADDATLDSIDNISSAAHTGDWVQFVASAPGSVLSHLQERELAGGPQLGKAGRRSGNGRHCR